MRKKGLEKQIVSDIKTSHLGPDGPDSPAKVNEWVYVGPSIVDGSLSRSRFWTRIFPEANDKVNQNSTILTTSLNHMLSDKLSLRMKLREILPIYWGENCLIISLPLPKPTVSKVFIHIESRSIGWPN